MKRGDWLGGRIVVGWRVRCVAKGEPAYWACPGGHTVGEAQGSTVFRTESSAERRARADRKLKEATGSKLAFDSVEVRAVTRAPTAKEERARIVFLISNLRNLCASWEDATLVRVIDAIGKLP